jgi:peptide/nickel transport system permease protein
MSALKLEQSTSSKSSTASSSGEVSLAPALVLQPPGLSQWELIRLHFMRNRLAVVAGWVIVALYLVVIFADFLAPYATNRMNESYVNAPPMQLHFRDENGWTLPYVNGYTSAVDPKTFQREFVADPEQRFYLRFFVRGDSYRLFGLFPTNLRLFGVEEPGVLYFLGTDRFGQDMFSRILAGTRISLTAGLLSVAISVILGSILGTLSGYYGGWIDSLVQRVIEVLSSMPRIPLWMTLAAALPPTWSSVNIYFGIVTILAFLGWTGLAREVRGKVLTIRKMDYTMAAKASGATGWYNIIHHMIPNSLSHIIVVATLAIPGMIIVESSLSFLGLGIQPPMTSLGVMLREAQNVRTLVNYPWLFTPAIVIIVSILSFNFLGDGLRDAADPYSN